MNKSKSRVIAINGILIALMIVFSLTMFVTGGMAFLPLTVLVVGSVILGPWTALILGFTFGLVSLGSAFLVPSPTAPFFQNPLISLLPRMIGSILAYGVFAVTKFAFSKIDLKRKKQTSKYLSKSISTVLGAIFEVFFNTLLCLSMIWIIYNGKSKGDVFVNKEFIMGLITINFVVEIIVTPILSAPIVLAVDKFLKKHQKEVVTEEDIKALDVTTEIDSNKVIDQQPDNSFENSLCEDGLTDYTNADYIKNDDLDNTNIANTNEDTKNV